MDPRVWQVLNSSEGLSVLLGVEVPWRDSVFPLAKGKPGSSRGRASPWLERSSDLPGSVGGEAGFGKRGDFPVEEVRVEPDGTAQLDLRELATLNEFADEAGRDGQTLCDLFGG